MRLLLDANLSPRLVQRLRDAGYHAAHVADLGLLTATDEEICDRAAAEYWLLVTAETDFRCCWRCAPRDALRCTARHVAELRPDLHGELLMDNLPAVAADLNGGAIVSLSPTRLSVRALPLS